MGLGNAIGIGIPTVNLGLGGGSEPVEERFVIQVKTDNAGSSADNEFTIPWIGTYDVDWGDGNTDTGVVDTQTHTYASAGTYDVAVTATTGRIFFNRQANDRRKLIDIKNWGTCEWTSMSAAFKGCELLEVVSAPDIPNLTNCTDTSDMFALACYNTSGKILNLINWDVSNVTNMRSMFDTYKRYNSIDAEGTIDFSNWDFSNVTNMEKFTSNSRARYGIIDCTNTSMPSLTNGYLTFDEVTVSNIGSLTAGTTFPGGGLLADTTLSDLDISNTTNFYTAFVGNDLSGITFDNWSDFDHVTVIRAMFSNCTNIPDVTGFDVSNVYDFQYVFSNSTDFNQDVSVWDVSSGTAMRGMFQGATSFDRSLASWNIEGITDFRNFMKSAGLSTANYDATLISWAAQNVSPNETIDFGTSQYTLGGAAETARNTLINTYGWTITDGGGIFVGLLDTYSGAAAAYSLRDLASASVGSAVVRVRRSNDNTEQDFTATEITDGTLTTFTGANDGFVTTWYDQSGNNKHATQPTLLYQRILVTAGVLNTFNGRPCDDYVAGSRAYNVPNDAYSAPFTYFAVAKPNATQSDVYSGGGNNGTSILSTNITRFYGGNFVDVNHNLGLDQIVTYALFNGVSSEFQVNDITPITTGNIGTSTNVSANAFGFAGYYSNRIQVFTGKFQEMIIYTSDKSTYREGVIANINNEYTIY